MTVRDFISILQKLDQDRAIWQIYDPPYAVWEPKITHLAGDDSEYAEMFSGEGVKEGDYAMIAG